MQRVLCLVLVLAVACLASRPDPRGEELRWLRGNTHTHTLWSDGDAAPEVPAAWYREHGYQFLVLSDHNVLSAGERWFPVDATGRLTPERVDALRERFGDETVEVREREGVREMRLHTLEELRSRFEVPGEFLFIQGEEITGSFRSPGPPARNLPVHVNGMNLAELIKPGKGTSAREVMNASVDAVIEQGQRLGRPTLAHINHPNFGWGLTWEDVAAVVGDRFFEVYNGHRGVRSLGDAEHLSTEEMWDHALTLRLTELDLGLLYGVATDDAHSHWIPDQVSIPGRGWVMVHAAALEAGAIIEAMKRGDFYASSGVALEAVDVRDGRYVVRIDREQGVQYTTRFIGTRMKDGQPAEIGVELGTSTTSPASYTFLGDELYVRAVVVSSKLHPDPYAEGDFETAWLQPVRPAGLD
ncbi:MAG: hypothetical protein E2O39_07955 [Planctomycetota bacterium]|nr:MAG: hypothetical protein E2O39_07955 [Planctomycetota bacterium]